MTRTVRNLRAASEEFAAAVEWYEEQLPGLGADFFDAVAETTTRIQAHPEIGAPTSAGKRTRRVLVPRFPYQVVYQPMADQIVIVAIAHLKRRPGYWTNRS
ncbi:MAG: type II toxin-antitoxin system RelE/ParE family toxin [Gemmatimonadota bacterium]